MLEKVLVIFSSVKAKLFLRSYLFASLRLTISAAVFLTLFVLLISCKSAGTTATTTTTTATITATLTPINHPPVLADISNKTISQESLLEFTISASDIDGDSLTFSASNLPPGASFNSSTRTFSWVPELYGTYTDIYFRVSDGTVTVSQAITINVNRIVPSLIAQPAEGLTQMAVLFYGTHTPAIDALMLDVRPQYVIINSPHGLWGEISGLKAFQNIAEYHAAGIKVIGYITAGYEGAGSAGGIDPKWYTLEMNQTLIKNMAEIDHVDGVFIDECSAFPALSSQLYLKTLTDLAHSYGLLTWGNVGAAQFDPWFFTNGGFDLMHSNEDWRGQGLTTVQRDWGYRISVSGTKPGGTAQDAFNLTVKAWQSGLAYCYITDSGYTSIPSWLEEYADILLKYKSSPGTMITFSSNPPGAEVWLDYVYKGVTPLNLIVPVGSHHIGFYENGYYNNQSIISDFFFSGQPNLNIYGDLVTGYISNFQN